jgi:hypothetical protein
MVAAKRSSQHEPPPLVRHAVVPAGCGVLGKDAGMNLFKIVSTFIAFVFVLMLLYWVAIGVIAYKAVGAIGEQDFSGGIRPVIEKLWCGKPGCLDKDNK